MKETNEQPTIFVIDDEKEVLEAIKWLLESVKYKVVTYQNPINFLQEYENLNYGCIIADIRTPGMSGLMFQQKIIKMKINLPLIFISGHADITIAVNAVKKGALDFLPKPIDNQMLLDCITKAVDVSYHKNQSHLEQQKYIVMYECLTSREKEVMKLMVQGKLTKIIAAELSISPHTAELHRMRVMKKMKVKSLAALVRLELIYSGEG